MNIQSLTPTLQHIQRTAIQKEKEFIKKQGYLRILV